MGSIGFPEMSVRNYHYSLRNSPQKRSSQNAARSFLHSCGKRQTLMYYHVQAFKLFLSGVVRNFNFVFLFGPFATDHSGAVIWGVTCLLSLDHWSCFYFRWDIDARTSIIFWFPIVQCRFRLSNAPACRLWSPTKRAQTRSEIRKLGDPGPHQAVAPCR
jgi:hypothetical protein